MWYDVNNTLSYNCLLNFVVGMRGVGKTYSCKRRAIKNWLTKGEQFVYLRRYDTEILGTMIEKFFDDISQEFPDHDFSASRGKFYCDKMVMGFYLPLSKSAQYKSVPFPNVSLIIFDEFIIDQGFIRYLPKEVHTFFELYSTIARLRDPRVLFLSNAITFTNPYFLYFDLVLQPGQKIIRKNDILLEMVDSPDYVDKSSKTRFGKIIEGTEYGNYAIKNQFLRDNDVFVEELPGPAICIFNVLISGEKFGVYRLRGETTYYVSDKYDDTAKETISLDTDSHNQTTVMRQASTARMLFESLYDSYMRGEVRFTSIKAKNMVTKALKKG